MDRQLFLFEDRANEAINSVAYMCDGFAWLRVRPTTSVSTESAASQSPEAIGSVDPGHLVKRSSSAQDC